jgi:hypothetical protein
LFIAPSYLFLGGLPGFLWGGVLSTLIVGLSLTVLNRLTDRIRCVPVVALIVGLGVAVVLACVYVATTTLFALPLSQDLSIFLAFGAALVLGGTSIFCLLADTRRYSLDWAARVNAELARLVSRARQELWLRQEQVARVVHGSVQARLHAARLRLAQAKIVTPEVIQAVLDDLAAARDELTKRAEIRSAVVNTTNPANPTNPTNGVNGAGGVDGGAGGLQAGVDISQDVASELEELADFWHGVCEVKLEVEPRAAQVLAFDPAATQSVIEVVAEAVSNAVTHGQASEVRVSIALGEGEGETIAVEVRNPAVAIAVGSADSALEPPIPGMGSRILSQLTHFWSLTTVGNETVMRAEIILLAPSFANTAG